MLDSIFGYHNFRNEVIWQRSSSHNDARQGLGRYGRVHDVILFYGKSRKVAWGQQFVPISEGHLSGGYKRVEPGTGRRYMEADLTANKPGGDTEYEWRGVRPYQGRFWAYSRANMEQFETEGRLIYRRTGMPRLKVYLDESQGIPLQDVWTDIPPISASSKERIGYPTQKPVALLDRIIKASCPPRGLVLDPFCGCGTTVVAAVQNGVNWAGIDISPTACELIKRRLATLGVEVKHAKMPVTDSHLRALKPFEFQNMVITAMNGTHAPRRTGDLGIDGYTFMLKEPIQVKQSENVGRPVVDSFEAAIERSGHNRGAIVAFSFTRGAVEEAARVRLTRGIEITLLRVADLFAESESPTAPPRLTVLPLPPRPAVLPSAEELVASDKGALPAMMDRLDDQIERAREPLRRVAEEAG